MAKRLITDSVALTRRRQSEAHGSSVVQAVIVLVSTILAAQSVHSSSWKFCCLAASGCNGPFRPIDQQINMSEGQLDSPVRPPIVITDETTRRTMYTEHSTVPAQPRLSIHLDVSRMLGCGDADPLRRDSRSCSVFYSLNKPLSCLSRASHAGRGATEVQYQQLIQPR